VQRRPLGFRQTSLHAHAQRSRIEQLSLLRLTAHFGRDCEVAADYIKQGKCKRNIEGRITLPSGAFIPRDIPGKCFKERLDEWHSRNPGQTAAGQLMYNVLSQQYPNLEQYSRRDDSPGPLRNTDGSFTATLDTRSHRKHRTRLLQLRNRKPEGANRPKERQAKLDS